MSKEVDALRHQHTLIGRRVGLKPLEQSDLSYLYSLSTNDTVGYRWRYRGTVPAIEQFVADLWLGVLTQFVIVDLKSSKPVGLVVAYQHDVEHGTAQIGIVTEPSQWRTLSTMEALHLFIRHLFGVHNLRKLYAEMPAFNYEDVSSGLDQLFRLEARLNDAHYWAGRYWDLLVLAIDRTEWETAAPRFDRVFLTDPSREPTSPR